MTRNAQAAKNWAENPVRAHVTRKLSDLHEILHTAISGSTCNVAQRASNPNTFLTFYFEVVSQQFEGFSLGLVHRVLLHHVYGLSLATTCACNKLFPICACE